MEDKLQVIEKSDIQVGDVWEYSQNPTSLLTVLYVDNACVLLRSAGGSLRHFHVLPQPSRNWKLIKRDGKPQETSYIEPKIGDIWRGINIRQNSDNNFVYVGNGIPASTKCFRIPSGEVISVPRWNPKYWILVERDGKPWKTQITEYPDVLKLELIWNQDGYPICEHDYGAITSDAFPGKRCRFYGEDGPWYQVVEYVENVTPDDVILTNTPTMRSTHAIWERVN